MSRDISVLIKEIEANGYLCVRGRAGHYKVKTPSGGTVATMPSSPSDRRSLLNTRAQLRRLGVLERAA